MQSINGAQFLNTISLFLLSACLAAALAPLPVTAFLLQVCMHHSNHKDVILSFKFNLTTCVIISS